MKKKLLALAVMSALTLTTASAFAATVDFSGDAKVEFKKTTGEGSVFDNRLRVNINADLGDNLYVAGRLIAQNANSNSPDSQDLVVFDKAYIGGDFTNFSFKAGRQPLFLGKGLLMDTENANNYVNMSGVGLGTSFDSVKLNGFVGKYYADAVERKANITTVDAKAQLGVVGLGASYLKTDNANIGEKYWGINADTKIMDNTMLNVEYVKNNDTKAKGYLAEVVYGTLAKKGDASYALSYRNIESGAVYSNFSTNDAYDNSKGFRVSASYQMTDNATVSVYQDIAKKKSDDSTKNRTDVKFEVKF